MRIEFFFSLDDSWSFRMAAYLSFSRFCLDNTVDAGEDFVHDL